MGRLLFQNKVPLMLRHKYKSMCLEVYDTEWLRLINEDIEFAQQTQTELEKVEEDAVSKARAIGAETPREEVNE